MYISHNPLCASQTNHYYNKERKIMQMGGTESINFCGYKNNKKKLLIVKLYETIF